MRQLFFMAGMLSVFILNAQQKDCHIHTVQPGEGIYYLSRLYTTKPAHIMSANPEIGKEMQIKVGQKICIPKSLSTIPSEQITEANKISQNEKLNPPKAATNSNNPSKQGDLWIHTVQKSETFYGICKLYQVLAYDMIATNNLPNTILAENQKLILPPTAIIPNQSITAKPIEVSPLVEMTNTAAVEAKKTTEKPVVTKEKKDVAEKKNAKPKEEKKEEKPLEKIEPAKIAAEVKNEPSTTDATKNKTHTVQKGDTYFNLTRKYNLDFIDIKTLNNLSSTDLQLGQVIIVSKPDVAIKEEKEEGIPANAVVIDISKEVAKKEAAKLAEPAAVESKVVKKKEPAPIKEKTKKATDEQRAIKEDKIIEKEEVKTNNKKIISSEAEIIVEAKPIEQKQPEVAEVSKPIEEKKTEVIVEEKIVETPLPDVAIKEVPQPEKTYTSKPVVSFSEEYGNSYNMFSANNNYKLKKARGVAEYTDAIKGNEYLVYYNEAEPGSIVKITNLMSKQSAYVKVMGGISTAENASNVSMKVSKKLAQQLQVLDDTFLVEVSRYAKN